MAKSDKTKRKEVDKAAAKVTRKAVGKSVARKIRPGR